MKKIKKIKRKSKKEIEKRNEERVNKALYLTYAILSFAIGFLITQSKSPQKREELITESAILQTTPEFNSYNIKGTTYREIILKLEGCDREFKITGNTYRAADRKRILVDLEQGDEIWYKMDRYDYKHMHTPTQRGGNHYNPIYDIGQGNETFIDFEKRFRYKIRQRKLGYSAYVIGLISLLYFKYGHKFKINYFFSVGLASIASFIGWYNMT